MLLERENGYVERFEYCTYLIIPLRVMRTLKGDSVYTYMGGFSSSV
jgi:hypothetical protein